MFYPISIRILKDECVGAKKLASNLFYYFIQGIEISDYGNSITIPTRRIEDYIFSHNDSGCNKLKLTFSAIVGENGAGKSTLVELFIRLINNFASAIFGEYSPTQGKPHLHFINGMQAELYFVDCNAEVIKLYRLRVENRHVTLIEFALDEEEDRYVIANNPLFDNSGFDFIIEPMKRYKAPSKWLKGYEVLEKFFYTYVSNFSIYAYNPFDYSGEATEVEYEKKCRRKGIIIPKPSECHWLEGMFHRKESYQIPILLYPSRTDGNININLEKDLAYSRFLSAIISERSQFRKINGHLDITGFILNVDTRNYGVDYIRSKTGFKKLNTDGYNILRGNIIGEWNKYVDGNLYDYATRRLYGEKALNYLCYKTLKISSEYPDIHRFFFSNNANKKSAFKDKEINQLSKLINKLAKDTSHITRKIRGTLFYLVYGLFDFSADGTEIDVTIISRHCAEVIKKIPKYREDFMVVNIHANGLEELVPPPFIKAEVALRDTLSEESVTFNSMSSGEKQFIYSLTGIMMMLVNLDSVRPNDNSQTVAYKNVNIILEEIELYFHPDLQRRLIKGIIEMLYQGNFQRIENVNFMVVTHSPFVLSDIPANNILALDKNGYPTNHTQKIIKSFSANIHDILRHPFFLKNGAVGEFAKDFLSELSLELNDYNGKNTYNSDHIKEKIDLIDEPIIHKIFMDEYYRKASAREQLRLIDEQIERLQSQRKTLTQ